MPCSTTELRAPASSGGETRTLNHTVNSRVLCQLSYPGKASRKLARGSLPPATAGPGKGRLTRPAPGGAKGIGTPPAWETPARPASCRTLRRNAEAPARARRRKHAGLARRQRIPARREWRGGLPTRTSRRTAGRRRPPALLETQRSRGPAARCSTQNAPPRADSGMARSASIARSSSGGRPSDVR